MATTVPPRFSPWLSLAAPHLCPDEGGKDGTMTPYAVLHLFLDRAHGLPPADLNGLSDPYVTAQINDMDVDVRSSTQNNTLAPRWGQSFYLSVYRPESIQVARSGGTDRLMLDHEATSRRISRKQSKQFMMTVYEGKLCVLVYEDSLWRPFIQVSETIYEGKVAGMQRRSNIQN